MIAKTNKKQCGSLKNIDLKGGGAAWGVEAMQHPNIYNIFFCDIR